MAYIENPYQLGNLEVGWWKAHNDHDKPKMALLLVQYNAALYGFTLDEAKTALQELIKGVGYHDTREWDKAVDAVVGYYQKVKEKTGLGFEPREVAELEVNWWKLHDELEHNPDKSQLAEAFAKLYAIQFGVNTNETMKAGKLKAEATKEHDLAEDSKTNASEVEEHWNKANHLLIEFYSELKTVLT